MPFLHITFYVFCWLYYCENLLRLFELEEAATFQSGKIFSDTCIQICSSFDAISIIQLCTDSIVYSIVIQSLHLINGAYTNDAVSHDICYRDEGLKGLFTLSRVGVRLWRYMDFRITVFGKAINFRALCSESDFSEKSHLKHLVN